MDNFLVFCGEDYYPQGGWEDFSQSFSDQELAIEYAKKLVEENAGHKWAQVVDLNKMAVIFYC